MTGSGATDRMTWDGTVRAPGEPWVSDEVAAAEICRWVERLGGQAWYAPDGGDEHRPDGGPRIVITGPEGPIYVRPGDTVVDTGDWRHCDHHVTHAPNGHNFAEDTEWGVNHHWCPGGLRLFRVDQAEGER